MSLRVRATAVSSMIPAPGAIVNEATPEGPPAPAQGDDWGARIAKLVPAEALGLYGTASGFVPADSPARHAFLWGIVLLCCVLAGIVRFRATRDSRTGQPQYPAIAIAIASFLIWLAALGGGASPIVLPASLSFAGPLVAFLWVTFVPYFYTGDA